MVSNELLPRFVLGRPLPPFLYPILSAGGIAILLAGLALLGLIGNTGRLTRLAALVGGVGLVAFVVVLQFLPGTGRIGQGVFVVFAGCVVAFIGGLFAKPSRK